MPWSLRTLVMGGYVVATVSLMGAAGYAVYSIEHLATQSERMLAEGIETTRLIDQVHEQIPHLQRVAQQVQVRVVAGNLDVAELQEIYERRHRRFLDDIDALAAYPWAPEVEAAVRELEAQSASLMSRVAQTPGNVDVEGYAGLRALAVRMHQAGLDNMDAALAALRSDVRQARNALLALALLLAAVAVLFAAAFSRLVTRPIGQIGAGIRSLGRAGFDSPIRVSGPTDLAAIGRLLDWLRERLKALEEQKVTFVRHMSHELKTPLANIREGSELLCEELDEHDDDKLHELAAIVRQNGIRLQKQMDSLFNFAALHDDSAAFTAEPFPLGRLLDEVLADYRFELAARGVTVDKHAPTGLVLRGDRERIRSLLDNVLSNAIKYSPRGGVVGIEVQRHVEEIVIEISDQGPGIPQGQREKVFLPFFQGAPPMHARVRGTGVGLSVARACVEAHGGRIEIVDHAAVGAHVRIRLPNRAAARAVARAVSDVA